MIIHKIHYYWLSACCLYLLTGCASSISSNIANSLTTAILTQDDPITVKDSIPAYLLLIDGFIAEQPKNTDLLRGSARLYSSYASVFVEDRVRAARMTDKSLHYAWQALCFDNHRTCEIKNKRYDNFILILDTYIRQDDLDNLYTVASIWIDWIQINSDDWKAIADLPKAEAMMNKVIALSPAYNKGWAQVYVGVLNSLRPPALGGKPEIAKKHFEQALEISQGKNLMAKTLYAKYYARTTFNKALHNRLLNEVIDTKPNAGEFTLTNTLAQEEARKLLADGKQYFVE